MILVDTSVLVDFLKGSTTKSTSDFDYILDAGIPYGINYYIYQEILQGARTIQEFQSLKEYLETIPFLYLIGGKDSYEQAALMNLNCRRSGITIRSTIDLLIARTAIEHDAWLLHNDKDFVNLAGVIPELKLYERV